MSQICNLPRFVVVACLPRMHPWHVVTAIPDSLGGLSNLTSLNLGGNQLKSECGSVDEIGTGMHSVCILMHRQRSSSPRCARATARAIDRLMSGLGSMRRESFYEMYKRHVKRGATRQAFRCVQQSGSVYRCVVSCRCRLWPRCVADWYTNTSRCWHAHLVCDYDILSQGSRSHWAAC